MSKRFEEEGSGWISYEHHQQLEDAALFDATPRLWAWSRRFGMDLIELAELDDRVWSPFQLVGPPSDGECTAALNSGSSMEVTFCSTPPIPVTRD